MLSSKMTAAIKVINDEIKESAEYRNFEKQKKIAKETPGTDGLIRRARDIRERLMDIPENERGSDYAESLQNEYEEITENTAVYDYSVAEAVYVTMLQEVFGSIVESVEI